MKQEVRENAEDRPVRKKRKKSRKWILAAAALVLLMAAVILVLYFVKVERFEVKRNQRLSASQITGLLYPEEEDTRLYKVLYAWITGLPKNEAFESASVKLSGLTSAVITVSESAPAFVIATDSYVNYYNSYGIRLPEPEHIETACPKLAGLGFVRSEMLKKPVFSPENGAVFEQCLSIFRMASEMKLPVDHLRTGEGQFTISFGTVRVSLGGYTDMLEKMHEISYMFPQYEGLSGTLHMENFDPDDPDQSYWFSVDTD